MDIKAVRDDGNGDRLLTGSDQADEINWQGNNQVESRNISFTGINRIDAAGGDDTVNLTGEIASLDALSGGAGEDTLVNQFQDLGWTLENGVSKLGGLAFTEFEKLKHELNTLTLRSESAMQFSAGSIALGDVDMDISAVEQFERLDLDSDGSITGAINTKAIDAVAGVDVDLINGGSLTVDNISTGGNTTVVSNGAMTINSLTSGGGVQATANNGALTVADTNSEGDVTLTSDADMTINSLTSGGDVNATARNGDLSVDTITAIGSTVSLLAESGNMLTVNKSDQNGALGEDYSINAQDVQLTVRNVQSSLGTSKEPFKIVTGSEGSITIDALSYYRPLYNTATTSLVSSGEGLDSVFDQAAGTTRRSGSYAVNELGNADPAIFTSISNFAVADNANGEPETGGQMVVTNDNSGFGTIESVATEFTAENTELEVDCAEGDECGENVTE